MIVDEQGNTPSYPIRQCTRCGNSTCKLAEDSKGSLLFWLSTGQYVDWPDVQSLPGWVNGWAPNVGPNVQSPVDMAIIAKKAKKNITMNCDCGAAKADYTISALGGPGHSDWCRVYSK